MYLEERERSDSRYSRQRKVKISQKDFDSKKLKNQTSYSIMIVDKMGKMCYHSFIGVIKILQNNVSLGYGLKKNWELFL